MLIYEKLRKKDFEGQQIEGLFREVGHVALNGYR